MPQLRVNLQRDHEKAQLVSDCGFRWCKKDKRFELNLRRPNPQLVYMLEKHGIEVTTSDEQANAL